MSYLFDILPGDFQSFFVRVIQGVSVVCVCVCVWRMLCFHRATRYFFLLF